MARYAQVCDMCGHVVNVIEWQPEGTGLVPPAGHTMVEDPQAEAGPGSTYVDGEFQPAPGMELAPQAQAKEGD